MNHRSRNVSISLLFILLTGVSAGAAEPAPLAIAVHEAAVTASGLTPGGAAVILAAWSFTSEEGSNVTNTWRAGNADAGGTFRTELSMTIPDGALLSALDVASGRLVTVDVGTPRFKRFAIPEKRFRRNPAREVEEMSSPNDIALIVVMRAGSGVWVQWAGDGGSADQDRKPDGFILTAPEAMTPIAGSGPAPARIKRKDVVLLVDAIARVFGSTEVAE